MSDNPKDPTQDLDEDSLKIFRQIDDALQPFGEIYKSIAELQELTAATSSTRWVIDSEICLDLSLSSER